MENGNNKPHRLIIATQLTEDQALEANRLMASEGLCTCGRLLKSTDAKQILGLINTQFARDPKARNTLIMAAYCYGCFMEINESMKRCKASSIILRPLDGAVTDPLGNLKPSERGHA